MATDFFERQRRARADTTRLRIVFALALAGASVLVAAGLVLMLGTVGMAGLFGRHPGGVLVAAFAQGKGGWWIAAGVLTFSALVAAGTAWKLRGSGDALARSLRAREVHSESGRPAERQLLNVVAEMALASGVPQPALYVIDRDLSINAFAAGRTIEGAVIGVTEGAVTGLDRDELQAVIAHEFSHILNGDMALNTRLIAWLSGFFAVERIARALRRDPDRKAGVGVLLFWWAHLGFWFFHACGYMSLLIGRMLQATICRRRETLADASAVQFTRNPQALKSALLKIEAAQGAGRIGRSGQAAGMAHLFIASAGVPLAGWIEKLGGDLLRTHPPMEERIRALDPKLSAQQYRAAVRETRKQLLGAEAAAAAPVVVQGETLKASTRAPLAGETPDLYCSRLNPDQQREVLAQQQQLAEQPAELMALYVAAVLDPAVPRAKLQLLQVAPVLGAQVASRVAAGLTRLKDLAPIARLPLLLALLPALGRVPERERAKLAKVMRAFAAQIQPADALRFAVSRLTLRALLHAPPPPPPEKGEPRPPIEAVREELGVLCALVARRSGDQGAAAYRAGLDGLLPPRAWPPLPAADPDAAAVDAALDRIAALPYLQRNGFAAALLRLGAANLTLGADEFDLLRFLCARVGVYTPGTGTLRLEPAGPRSALPAAGGS